MKKIYMLIAAFCIAGMAVAEGPYLLIDEENFSDWGLTKEEQPRDYMDWEYTTPNGLHLEFNNSRYDEAGIVDIQPDNAGGDEPWPGGMYFTVSSASQIDVNFRSASNNNEPDRWMYISKFNIFEEWDKISDDLPVTWGSPHWMEVVLDEEITEDTRIAFRGGRIEGGGGAFRLHGFRVWTNVPTSIDGSSVATVQVYSVPGDSRIRIGGAVTSVEVYNLAGNLVYSSAQAGFQGLETSTLSNGVYLVKVTDVNGLTKVEKVVVR